MVLSVNVRWCSSLGRSVREYRERCNAYVNTCMAFVVLSNCACEMWSAAVGTSCFFRRDGIAH